MQSTSKNIEVKIMWLSQRTLIQKPIKKLKNMLF